MKLVDEIKNIKWNELTNERIKQIHVHTTKQSLMRFIQSRTVHRELATKDVPELYYVKVGVNMWEVHALSWELSQFLKMKPTKSPSSKVAPTIESELEVKCTKKSKNKIVEVPEEVTTQAVDSDDSVETESTEITDSDDNQ